MSYEGMGMGKQKAGLKKQRANQVDKKPKYECSNCKCKRYSPCGCMKASLEMPKENKSETVPEAIPEAPKA